MSAIQLAVAGGRACFELAAAWFCFGHVRFALLCERTSVMRAVAPPDQHVTLPNPACIPLPSHSCSLSFANRSVRKQGEADREWFCVSEPGVRDVDHVITTAELGNIFKVRKECSVPFYERSLGDGSVRAAAAIRSANFGAVLLTGQHALLSSRITHRTGAWHQPARAARQ